MKVLSINVGSSSLKFTLFKFPEKEVLAKGYFERIGLNDSYYVITIYDSIVEQYQHLKNHENAINVLSELLIDLNIVKTLDEINIVAHRVVHGEEKYKKPTIIDHEVISDIKKYSILAPLHNPINLMGIETLLKILPNVFHVAVFDTSFYQTIKPNKYLYPIDLKFYEEDRIRKYGFHGTSHKYITNKLSEKLNKTDLKIINCHLGNGVSITAIDSNKAVDTSMGFTPLSGAMMGTRSGDIDLGVVEYLENINKMTIEEIMNTLNKKSGLLGVSKISHDIRDLEKSDDPRAKLALDMFTSSIADYIVVYNNLLNNADIISFTAGIGEKSFKVRKMILDKLKTLNIILDEEKNQNTFSTFEKISKEESKIDVYVVPTNEELLMAMEAYQIVRNEEI